MRFGEALELCKKGARIKRTGWNGKDQFVYYQQGSAASVPDLRCPAIKEWTEKTAYWQSKLWGISILKLQLASFNADDLRPRAICSQRIGRLYDNPNGKLCPLPGV